VSSSDEVRLAVPAIPEYLRLARVTAAGLASRIGFSFDEVEDLRLAIDELCYGLTGNTGRPGTVEVRYRVEGDRLVIEGDGHFEGTDNASAVLSELSRVILAALVDEHEMIDVPGRPRFRLVKQRRAADDGSTEGGTTSQ
jgi:serine/threonine-protein kinase RsbW